MREFICVFTTGRTGTALLTQLFSGVPWHKGAFVHVCGSDGVPSVVGHEGWALPIQEIKQNGPEYSPLRVHIERALDNRQRLFLTDNRIGRFYAPILANIPDTDVRIIYLQRNSEAVIASFLKRITQRKKTLPAQDFTNYKQTMWDGVLYQPTDLGTILPYSGWDTAALKARFNWYCRETAARWQAFKATTNLSYMEIDYEQLSEESVQRQLAAFIRIPHNPAMCKHRVNQG